MRRARWHSRLLVGALLLVPLGACRSFDAAQEKAQGDPEFLYEGALQALASGRLVVARDRIDKAIVAAPLDAKLHNGSALIGIFERNYPLVLSAADEALRLDPKLTDARNNRGIALLNQDRAAEAEVDFRAVLADANYPRRSSPQLNLGSALLRLGRFDEALAALYEAKRMAPDHAQLARLLGEAREGLGDWDTAAANYLEAFKRDDKDAVIAVRLGRCFEKLGQLELARRYWTRAVALAPEAPEVAEARRGLAAAAGHRHSD